MDSTEIPIGDQNSILATEKSISLASGEVVKMPSLHIEKATLYHGSPVKSITEFQEGDQQSIGRGVYFTIQKDPAIGYAIKRSNNAEEHYLYQADVENMDLCDLRDKEGQEQFAKLFKEALIDYRNNKLSHIKGLNPDLLEIVKAQRAEQIEELIKKIDDNSFRQLRDLTFGWADLTTKTLWKHDYQGLVSLEGEEPFGFHDSYIIFEPSDLKNIRMETLANKS